MGEESVVLQCKLMRCMNKDPLAAVKPVAMESVVVPPGGSCANLMHGGGAREEVKHRAV